MSEVIIDCASGMERLSASSVEKPEGSEGLGVTFSKVTVALTGVARPSLTYCGVRRTR